MPNINKLKREIELKKELFKIKARNKLINFITYTDSEYDPQWFHKIACDYIDKLQKREIKKLIILQSYQTGKSTISSINAPAYLLGKDPNEKIIIGSYNKSKATDFVKKVKRKVKSDEYKELFPNTKVEGSDTDEFFEVNGGTGYVKSAGMDSGVTGFTASCVIIDDPLKGRSEANSKTIRDKTWNTYNDDFRTRLDNNGIILMLFTRWHINDFAGRLFNPNDDDYNEQEASEWTVLIFQALKEKELPLKQAVIVDDPREIDESIWEEKHSAEKFKQRRITNPAGFASLNQQNPIISGGNKIKDEWWIIKNESELPFNSNLIACDFFIDGAFTDKTTNDETALLSCYYNKAEDKLYIFNCQGVRKELYEFLPYFKQYTLANRYKRTSSIFIELKASGQPMKSMLSKLEFGGFNCRGIDNKAVSLGKMNRVENAEPFIASGKVVLVKGSWNKSFIDQCSAFPNGVHDDMVDVLTYAIHHYLIKTGTNGVSYEN